MGKLMGREKQAASLDITASDFQKYFVDKIAAVVTKYFDPPK